MGRKNYKAGNRKSGGLPCYMLRISSAVVISVVAIVTVPVSVAIYRAGTGGILVTVVVSHHSSI